MICPRCEGCGILERQLRWTCYRCWNCGHRWGERGLERNRWLTRPPAQEVARRLLESVFQRPLNSSAG